MEQGTGGSHEFLLEKKTVFFFVMFFFLANP